LPAERDKAAFPEFTADTPERLPFWRDKKPTILVGILRLTPVSETVGVLKNLTSALEFCKQICPLKRRFHAASLRGSCGSPLGSTSNPKKTQELRIRAPRKSQGGRSRVKSQRLIRASVFGKQFFHGGELRSLIFFHECTRTWRRGREGERE
jgi:hypothetical protein